MKGKIISLLKTNYPGYISGEEISRIMGVSRTAVWKHIAGLREDGYIIESHSRVGYRLIKSPDRPFEFEFAQLREPGQVIGREIIYKEEVDSTNEVCKTLAEEGAVEGTVVIAEKQNAGKGRMGRRWHSPAGQGIWFSFILRPVMNPGDASKVTLMAAVAVATAIQQVTGIKAGIKWPNDILLEGRKLAGILTEMNAETDKINYLVIGIGINVCLQDEELPSELRALAVSLAEEKGVNVSRTKLLAEILRQLDCLYKDFQKGIFTRIFSMWRDLSVTLNRTVTVKGLHYTEEGFAVDIDDTGALLLRDGQGNIKRIYSGDVSIR